MPVEEPGTPDQGLAALVALLRFHGLGADPEQIRHRFGSQTIGVAEMLRCAKEMGLKARVATTRWQRLAHTPLPAIAALQDGRFLILGKVSEVKALVQSPSSSRPSLMSRDEFEAVWDGRLVLMARRAGLSDLGRRFDISWFLGAIHKYRYLLGEVLIASFFLQLFALVSPLFFQVVIDKVLVHRTLSTLDVLVIGLITVGIFEAILGGLRTYLFAHSTNRIDVELGARLFRHLMALPVAYFEARRTGDSVARVRELENIRQFLTSSALTLVIDLFFCFVFLAVMYYYAPILTWIVLGAFPFYIAISAGATPLFRRRLDEKFRRGAENQAFLVESVTGVETLKAMAVEPQMQRRWEEQLAGYVSAELPRRQPRQHREPGGAADQQARHRADPLFRRQAGDRRQSDGRRAGRLQHAGRAGDDAGAAAGADVAGFSSGAPFGGAARRHPQHRAGTELQPGARRAAGDPRRSRFRARHLPLPDRRAGSAARYHLHRAARADRRHRRRLGFWQEHARQADPAPLRARRAGACWSTAVDLAMVDIAWLRRQIGVVLQENVLFNRSVRDNIALADPAMPIERVIAVAQLAGAHEFILEMPEGYDTIIGERGSSLSGGQRQRIAIARALVMDPRILIFDEATSALDYASERVIQANMQQIAHGRTVFIIAHRLSTVRHTHRILTLDRGRLVEDGTHDELVRTGGRYAMLHRLQAGIQEIAN